MKKDITSSYSCNNNNNSNSDSISSYDNNSCSVGSSSSICSSSSSSSKSSSGSSYEMENLYTPTASAILLKTVSPSFCIVTWGDSDIGTILKEQCIRHKIELPLYFNQWINLKSQFKQHFGWEPHGGLQRVVERCGFSFDGRAHSGLVDSFNTAKIVKKMLEGGFRFSRATRNIFAYKRMEKDTTQNT